MCRFVYYWKSCYTYEEREVLLPRTSSEHNASHILPSAETSRDDIEHPEGDTRINGICLDPRLLAKSAHLRHVLAGSEETPVTQTMEHAVFDEMHDLSIINNELTTVPVAFVRRLSTINVTTRQPPASGFQPREEQQP